MANPWHHAVSSSRKWGGTPEDYLHVHEWFDATKGWLPDFRHRAIRHHSEGIAQCVELFEPIKLDLGRRQRWCGACFSWTRLDEAGACPRHGTDTLNGEIIPEYKVIPIRWVAEQHVMEDCGRIPTAADWLRCMTDIQPWMTGARKLSREQEMEDGTQHDG